MNCAELATTMCDLGAWRVMNPDGCGSSTMYIRGRGVLNDPSDGSQRVVAKHLSVYAAGSGAPWHCDLTDGEALDQAGVPSTPGGTEVSGDGRADLCGRAVAGCERSPTPATPTASTWRRAPRPFGRAMSPAMAATNVGFGPEIDAPA